MPEWAVAREHKDGYWREKDMRVILRDDSIGEENVSAAESMEHLLKIEVGNQRTDHAMRLSNVMRKLGWERPSNGYVTIADHGRVKSGSGEAAPRYAFSP